MVKAAFSKTRVLALAAFLAIILAPVSIESATASQIPPGFSVVDQYTEAFPGAGGDEKPPSGGDQNKVDNFPGKTVDQFTQAGAAGVSALNLAAAGAPERALDGNTGKAKKAGKDQGRNGDSNPASGGGSGSTPSVEGSQQVAKQVFGVAGSDGMGIFLPLILVMAVLLGAVYSVRSKRHAF